MKIIAHRGYFDKDIKENTYRALCRGINSKDLEGIEFDIHLTKDKKLVIIHDYFINRTSNGQGMVEKMTLEELRKYNYGSKKNIQTIATLDKILDIKTKKMLLIEIKCYRNAKIMAKIIKEYLPKDRNNIYFISFNERALNYLKNNYKVGYISIKKMKTKGNIIVANKLFYKKYNGIKKLFLYTIKSKQELNYGDIYYICDNVSLIFNSS